MLYAREAHRLVENAKDTKLSAAVMIEKMIIEAAVQGKNQISLTSYDCEDAKYQTLADWLIRYGYEVRRGPTDSENGVFPIHISW